MSEIWSSILRPRKISVYPVPMIQQGPRTFSGRQQLGAPDAGYWGMKAGFQIYTRDQLLEWRGLVAAMQGGLNSVVIGVFDSGQAPTLIEGGPVKMGGITHSDGSTFDDGAGYSQSTISVTLHDGLAEGDVTADLDIGYAGPLRRGMYFSVADRLSIITKPPTFSIGGARAQISFWPPSRVAAASGSSIEFGRPKVTMQLADTRSGAVDLSGLYYGEPTIEFVESFDGL